jgi:hypothetical protein
MPAGHLHRLATIAGLGDDLYVRFGVEYQPNPPRTMSWSSATRTVITTSPADTGDPP